MTKIVSMGNNPHGRGKHVEPEHPSPIVRMSDARPRGRTVKYEDVLTPPKKILTISDLPQRRGLGRQMARDLRQANAVMGTDEGGLFANWEHDPEIMGPKRFADYMPNGAWAGHRCFIIGGGPSVKNVDVSKLQGEFTIGINRAYELLSPTILFGVDGQLFGWAELGQLGEESKRKFQEYAGFKVWIALHTLYPDDTYLIEPDTRDGYRIGSTRCLAFKNNSGYGASNLAAALGANPIYLLGFDMHGNRQGKQAWWHDGYPVDYGENVYTRYIEELNNFAPTLQQAGVRVVNLNPKSSLRCFEFSTLAKVLNAKPAKPKPIRSWMVVSFYTAGTGYETEVKKLTESLDQFNIPRHIFACKPTGTWRGNLNYKSEIILKAMDMYPDKDIVFIDSDGIVRKPPVLFTKLSKERKADVAAHYHQYTTSVTGGSLLSGTLWFANNETSRVLVRRWHQIGLDNPTVRHQHCLNIAINELGKEGVTVRVHRMPQEYTQIYDYKGVKHENAVVEHFQASRRLRKQVGQGDALMDSDRITL